MSLAERIDWGNQAGVPAVSRAAQEMLALFGGIGREEIVKAFPLPERSDDRDRFIHELGLIPTVGIAPHEAVGLRPEQVVSHDELDVWLVSKAPQRRGGSFVVRQVIQTGDNSSVANYWARQLE